MFEVFLQDTSTRLDLDIDMRLTDETLDQDLKNLPHTIAKYAQLMAECQAHAANRKMEADRAEAQEDINIRKAASTAGDKITEPAIKQRIILAPAVQAAKVAYFKADAQHKTLDGFYRALREKASIGIALCYKQKEEIRVMNSPIN
jgi:hypothetical protein